MSNDAPTIQDIQQRMREVRRELRCDVHQLAASTEEMTDWRFYVRAHPWACMGTALMVGYFIVPSRYSYARLDTAGLDAVANVARQGAREERSARNGSWGRIIAKTVASAALRGALGYIGNRVATSTAAMKQVDEEVQRV
jgi:hypothetical protein